MFKSYISVLHIMTVKFVRQAWYKNEINLLSPSTLNQKEKTKLSVLQQDLQCLTMQNPWHGNPPINFPEFKTKHQNGYWPIL